MIFNLIFFPESIKHSFFLTAYYLYNQFKCFVIPKYGGFNMFVEFGI
jgi:hypothetical protein